MSQKKSRKFQFWAKVFKKVTVPSALEDRALYEDDFRFLGALAELLGKEGIKMVLST